MRLRSCQLAIAAGYGYMPLSACSRFQSRIWSHVMPSKKLFLWRIPK